MVDEAKRAGYEIVTIPSNLKEKIHGTVDPTGAPIVDLGQFHLEYMESFKFKFIDPKQLSAPERKVFDLTKKVFQLIGGKPKTIKEVKVSETMRRALGSFVETEGLWESGSGTIIIKRTALRNSGSYVGTLIHEIAHATSGAQDVSREFELELTRLTGIAGSKALDA